MRKITNKMIHLLFKPDVKKFRWIVGSFRGVVPRKGTGCGQFGQKNTRWKQWVNNRSGSNPAYLTYLIFLTDVEKFVT